MRSGLQVSSHILLERARAAERQNATACPTSDHDMSTKHGYTCTTNWPRSGLTDSERQNLDGKEVKDDREGEAKNYACNMFVLHCVCL